MNRHVGAYVRIYAFLYAHTRTLIRIYAYTYTHIRVYLYAHTRILIRTYAHTYTHIRLYLYAYYARFLVNVYLSGTVHTITQYRWFANNLEVGSWIQHYSTTGITQETVYTISAWLCSWMPMSANHIHMCSENYPACAS